MRHGVQESRSRIRRFVPRHSPSVTACISESQWPGNHDARFNTFAYDDASTEPNESGISAQTWQAVRKQNFSVRMT